VAESVISRWLDFAIQQMVAEAYLDQVGATIGGLASVLKLGSNNPLYSASVGFDPDDPLLSRQTRLTDTQIAYFNEHFEIIDHYPNDNTGFSGTLMRDRRTGAYTLSFRSTEYPYQHQGGDWERDGAAGADGEIFRHGFAFGQLLAAQEYYEYLKASGLLPQGAALNVTGYSLGAHLATVFTEINATDTHVVFEQTYTFNGPGRGSFDATVGSLVDMLQYFRSVLADPERAADQVVWSDPDDVKLYESALQARGTPFPENIYTDPRYAWAVSAARWRFRTDGVSVGSSVDNPALSGLVTQLVGHAAHNDTEIVANAGIHAPATFVFIEDQPDIRGLVFEWAERLTGLQSSFGDTHSITLIADSLAVMALLERLGLPVPIDVNGRVDLTEAYEILAGASNQLGTGFIFSQGQAEGDSLEKVVEALYAILLKDPIDPASGVLTLPYDRRGGSFGNLHHRAALHEAVAQINERIDEGVAADSLVSIVDATADVLAAAARASDAYGARYALRMANSFILNGSAEIYAPHNTGGELELYDRFTRQGTLTNRYIEKRAEFVERTLYYNREDARYDLTKGAPQRDEAARRYDDKKEDILWKDLTSGITINRGVTDSTRYVLFGTATHDLMVGDRNVDHLFGEGGNDFLQGGRGDDYLEGGPGEDIYYYRLGDGFDTILDTDGSGRILILDDEGRQLLLGAGRQLSEEGVLYQARIHTSIQYRIEPDGSLIVLFDGDPVLKLENFRTGDLGIALEDIGGSLLPYRGALKPPEEWQEAIVGDRNADDLDDDIDADPITQVLVGGLGNDILSGHAGEANYVQTIRLYGGPGDDVIHGEDYYSARYYFIGREAFEAENGVLQPGPGVQAFGESGNDRFLGSLRDDTFNGGEDHDYGDGHVGNDTLLGDVGNDLLNGDEGDDRIEGSAGDDRLAGGAGSDHLIGGANNDQIYGDSDYRVLRWDGTNFVLVYGTLETGTFPIVQDVSEADAGADLIEGGAGEDELYGGAGDDLLDGGEDADRIQGEGDDDVIFGGDGDDRIFGDWSVDIAQWDARVIAGDHGTYTYYWRLRHVGVEGDDHIDGGAGNDMIWGGGGADYLAGGDDDDILVGGLYDGSPSGNDTLHGGKGDDQLYGEDGDDVYVYERGDGVDVVFETEGTDTVVFGEGILVDDIELHLSRTDTLNLVLQHGHEGRLTLHDWYNPTARVEYVRFADGTVWDADYLQNRVRLLTATSENVDLEGAETSYEVYFDQSIADGFELSVVDAGGNDILRFNSVLLAQGPFGSVYLRPTLEKQVGDGSDLLLHVRLEDGVNTTIRGTVRLVDFFGNGQIERIQVGDTRELVAPEVVSILPGVYLRTSSSQPFYERFNINSSYFGISSVVYTGSEADEVLSPIAKLAGGATYYGNGGSDLLIGGTGNDTLVGGSGADRMEGRRGDDIYYIDPADADAVYDDGLGATSPSSDYLVVPTGLRLEDLTFAREGNDLLIGATRVERYFERDYEQMGIEDYPYLIERLRGENFELPDLAGFLITLGLFGAYVGTPDDDVLDGDQYGNTMLGEQGNDVIWGGRGDDKIFGGEGDDRIFGEGAARGFTPTYNDYIDGGSGSDYLQGELGQDTLFGGDGDDVLYGDEPHSGFYGFRDQDVLIGGVGSDLLLGGRDGDRYVFQVGDGSDFIRESDGNSWDRSLLEIDQEIARVESGATYTSSTWYAFMQVEELAPLMPVDLVDRITTMYFGYLSPDDALLTLVQLRDWLSATGVSISESTKEELSVEIARLESGAVYYSVGDWLSTFIEFKVLDRMPTELAAGVERLRRENGDSLEGALSTLRWVRQWMIDDHSDVVELGPGITRESLVISVEPDALRIEYGPGDSITVLPAEDEGDFQIERFRFSDGSVYTLDELLAPPNTPPTLLVGLPDQVAAEDETFSYVIPDDAFVDADPEDELTYRATQSDGQPLPSWLHFDPTTKSFIGVPTNGDVGSVVVRVTVTDATGASVSDDFALTVTNTNDAPALAEAIDDLVAIEDEGFQYTVPIATFVDIDADDRLSISAALSDGSSLPAWLSFDTETLMFSGTPGNEDVGDLEIRLTATDTFGATADDVFILRIENVNDAPVLMTPVPDQDAIEDEHFYFALPADAFQDIDLNDVLAYGATQSDGSPLPSWLIFDPVNRTFQGTPGNGDVGSVQIRVTATDTSGASIEDVFALNVVNTNDSPIVAAGLPNHSINEYETFVYQVAAEHFVDPDSIHGDGLTYAARLADGASLPSWLSFDPSTRTFVGTPTLDARGEHTIVLTATDRAGASATASFAINVVAVGNGIRGSDGVDLLVGTGAGDVVAAGAGADLLIGIGGNDILDSGEGHDALLGGSGNDVLLGGAGNDLLYGGTGDDRLRGGSGNDLLVGDSGNDVYIFNRGDGEDTILAGDRGRPNDSAVLGVEPLHVILSRAAGDLEISLYGSDDRLTISHWYRGGSGNRLSAIGAANGSMLFEAQVDQLIQAMNQFLSENGGITWEQAIAERPQEVESVLAAYWQPAA